MTYKQRTVFCNICLLSPSVQRFGKKNVRVHKVQLRNLKGKCLVTCFSRITMLHFVGLYYAVIDTSVIQN